MATLQDIRRRIRSVQSTQKITRAMKLVAAAKLRRAQDRAMGARPYARKMTELVATLAGGLGADKHPLLAPPAGTRPLLVVVTADKGLCGAFNANVLRRALEFLRAAADPTLVTVGRKGRDFFRRRPWPIEAERTGVLDRVTFDDAQDLAGVLMRRYLAGEAGVVSLVYNEFRSVAVQRVRIEQLLPVDAGEPAAGGTPPVDYLFEPDPGSILDALLPRHVEVQVYRTLLESSAGEHGARMTAMEAATKNAQEMIGLLTIQYNKARQERITKELLDIVGGAEALRQGADA